MNEQIPPGQNGWIKSYKNNTQLIGSDTEVEARRCSWSKSALDSMTSAYLQHSSIRIKIIGDGEYWQSDTLLAPFKSGEKVPSVYYERRIQKLISIDDKYLIVKKPTPYYMVLETSSSNLVKNLDNIVDVLVFKSEEVGSWLVCELSLDPPSVRWYVSRERI